MGKYNSDAENEVYKFIKILVVVVILVVGFYFLTNSFVSKSKSNDKETTETEISSNTIIVGSLLNRPYDDYYVLAFKSEDIDSVIYQTYISLYSEKENSNKIYLIDLDNELNSKYYSKEGNTNAKKIDELKISSPTLIKVTNHKISKYIEGKDSISKELGI